MKKPTRPAKPEVIDQWPDGRWLDRFPLLCEHISDATWEDGSPREVSTLVIRGQDSMVMVAVNDREAKQSLYRSGNSVEEALTALEAALEGTAPDWRPWSGKGGAKGKPAKSP